MRLIAIAMLGALVLATAASARVLNEELSSEAVLSGEANEKLEAIGRRAAEAGLVLQVNAPDLWESEILTPVRRGAGNANLEIEFVNTMSETVVIRGVKPGENEDPLETLRRITNSAKVHSVEAEESADSSGAPAPAAEPEERSAAPQRPAIERPSMDMPEVKIERPRAALPRADATKSSRRARGERAAAAIHAPATGTGNGVAGVSELSRVDDGSADEEAERFERLYNNGRTIRRSLRPDELEAGDLIFTGEYHNVVVRRGISTDAFWLEGGLPTDRLRHDEQNRYVVEERETVAEADSVESPNLPGNDSERDRFEQIYNQGRDIEATIAPASLMPEDELYVGDTVTVVLRRSKVSIDAYWLGEPIDLDQPGIKHDRKNKYVVVGDIR